MAERNRSIFIIVSSTSLHLTQYSRRILVENFFADINFSKPTASRTRYARRRQIEMHEIIILACECRQSRHILSPWCMGSEIVCTISPRYLDKLWQIILNSFLWNAKRIPQLNVSIVYAKPNHNTICFLWCWCCGGSGGCYYLLARCLHDDFWCNMWAACLATNEKSIWETIYCLANWYNIFIWFRLVSYSFLFISSIYVVDYYYSIKSNLYTRLVARVSRADRWRVPPCLRMKKKKKKRKRQKTTTQTNRT